MVTGQVATSSGAGDVAAALSRERWHTKLGTVWFPTRSQSFQCRHVNRCIAWHRACHSIVRTALVSESQRGLGSVGCVSGVVHGVSFQHSQPNTSLERIHERAVYEPPFSLGRSSFINGVPAVSRAPLSLLSLGVLGTEFSKPGKSGKPSAPSVGQASRLVAFHSRSGRAWSHGSTKS